MVTGPVSGSGQVGATGSTTLWTLTVPLPPDVPADTQAGVVIWTVTGRQAFFCAPVVAGVSTVTCTGTTTAPARQGATVVVYFSDTLQVQGTVQGPGPTSPSVAAALAQVQPSGHPGLPCASQVGAQCAASGAVQGSGTVSASMSWSLTATVPAGVAASVVPVAVVSTTAGLQAFPCAAVTAGAATVTCTGITAANARQSSAVTVVFGPGLTVAGTVTGPGGQAGLAGLGILPLLPPPPPPPILPPPPLLPVAPFSGAAPAVAAEVPVIPEAESAALVGAGLLAWAGLVALQRRRRSSR
jgi:hypothetical protein